MSRLHRQLADAEADERHAFLLLGWEHMESVLLHSRDTRELPAAAPNLPDQSMDYGLQASRRRHEFSPGFLGVGGLKVAGRLRI
jgi:hypothetical protein